MFALGPASSSFSWVALLPSLPLFVLGSDRRLAEMPVYLLAQPQCVDAASKGDRDCILYLTLVEG